MNGFDFGVDQFFMVVSDFQFSNLLHDASIGGCAYGLSHSNEVGATVPFVSLGARRTEPLKRAFEILRSWDRRPGDDGFNLEFILLQSGGYLITISPDFEALRGRVAKSDRFFAPLGVNVSWIFELSRQGPWIPDFRRYVDRPVAPFIFAGSELISANEPPRHLADIPEILKFQARFSEEGAGNLSSFASAILERRSTQQAARERSRLPPRPEQTPLGVRARRAEQLRRHFPVTLSRLASAHAFEEFRTRNLSLNTADWQYQQAYCNVVLSTEITGRPHYPNLPARDLVGAIGDRLTGRIEMANVSSLSAVPDDVLIRQLLLDGAYLLEQRGYRKVPDDLAELAQRLAAEGLL